MDKFERGSPLDAVFKALEEKIKAVSESAAKSMLKVYDNKPTNPFTSGRLLSDIAREHKLECGCCYKMSAPVMDMVAAELAVLQTIVDEIKGKITDKELLERIDHRERVLQVIFDGIKEIVVHENRTGEDLYTGTMKRYAQMYRANNPEDKKTPFDNISGLEEVIEKIVANRKKEGEDNIIKGMFQ